MSSPNTTEIECKISNIRLPLTESSEIKAIINDKDGQISKNIQLNKIDIITTPNIATSTPTISIPASYTQTSFPTQTSTVKPTATLKPELNPTATPSVTISTPVTTTTVPTVDPQPTTTTIANKPIYKYSVKGTVIHKYSDNTINVSIERFSDFYVTKVWVKDPSKQVKKKQANTKTLKNSKTLKNMLDNTKNAIVGCNASSFSMGGDKTATGNLIITNGKVLRPKTNVEKVKDKISLGMLQNGSFKYYETFTYADITRDGVKNSFRFGPILINNGVAVNGAPGQRPNQDAYRNAIGQMDENNYVILTARKTMRTKAVQNFGLKLGCKLLYNLDGGGSTALWFRGKASGKGKLVRSSDRGAPDTIYFVTAK